MAADPLADLARLDGLPLELAAARDAVDVLLRDRGLRSVGAEQAARARLDAAQASASLTDDPEGWLPGAARLYAELPALAGLVQVSPGQVLARCHTLAAFGIVSGPALGRLRAGGDAARRMAAVGDLLTRPTGAPAIVLAAIVHAEIAVVTPFGSADGLVARAMEHLVLMSSGVDPLGVVVVEAGHAAAAEVYRTALQHYAGGTVAGVRDWIVHCARALTAGVSASPLAHRR